MHPNAELLHRFYAAFAVSLGATMGIALADNMFTLFVFYEVLTLSTYPLVTHAGTEEARRGGRVYLGLLLGTSTGFLLLAIVWTWSLAGTLDFREGGVLRGTASATVIGILLALYVFGLGHIGAPLARLAAECGFSVKAVDGRADFADEARFATMRGDIEVRHIDPVDAVAGIDESDGSRS